MELSAITSIFNITSTSITWSPNSSQMPTGDLNLRARAKENGTNTVSSLGSQKIPTVLPVKCWSGPPKSSQNLRILLLIDRYSTRHFKREKVSFNHVSIKITDNNNYAFHVLIIMNFTVLPPGDSKFKPKALGLSVSTLLVIYTLSSQCGWGSPESTIYVIP